MFTRADVGTRARHTTHPCHPPRFAPAQLKLSEGLHHRDTISTQSTCCPQCHHGAAVPKRVRMPYSLVEAPAFFATFIGPRLAEALLTATA